MPKTLPRTHTFKHVIRPDGSIRVATKSSIVIEDNEILVQDTRLRKPGRWFYDFKTKKLVEFSDAQLKAKRDARKAAIKKAQDEDQEGLRTFRDKIQALEPDVRDVILELARRAGVQL